MIRDKNNVLEAIKEWNFWESSPEVGIIRGDYLNKLGDLMSRGGGQVVVVTGARRSGKSYILRQMVKKMVDSIVRKEDTVYLNFEDVRLGVNNVNDLDEVYQMVIKHLGFGGQKIVFLDEVQLVEGWERWVRTMHDLRKARVVISGSNSRILTSDLGTKLTGRHIDMRVFPLSLMEFVSFHNGEDAQQYLRNYLVKGGFPLPVLEPKSAKQLLLDYFTDIVARDVAGRYNVRKLDRLMETAKYAVSNYSCSITFNSIARYLELKEDTVRNYLEYLEEAFLVFQLHRFSYKPKEVEKSPRKIYCIDTGLAGVVGLQAGQNIGRLAENAVFLHLLRKEKEFYYWKDTQQHEVDFVVVEGNKPISAIGVCWDMSNPKTKSREVKSMVYGLKDLGLNEGLFLVENSQKDEVVDGKVIRFKSLGEWLMT